MRSSTKGNLHYYRFRFLRLVIVIAIILTVTLAALERRIIRIYYRPIRNAHTDFTNASLSVELRPPLSPLRTFGGGHSGLDFDDRYAYMSDLGRGCEGITRLYEDRTTGRVVVIKSWFHLGGRNQLPAELREVFHHRSIQKWPAEIHATLLFAGLEAVDQITESACSRVGFLPAVDYFVATPSKKGRSKNLRTWHLVTPYISGGTLEDLADRVRQEGPHTPQDLDLEFRSSFNRTLTVLETLHTKGYCHDDIKMDNTLVLDPYTWVLSDLGNVREHQHPYHDTVDWKRKDQWSNCRTNDVRRLLKTYLSFLRAASAEKSDFDDRFFEEHQAWSRLYWDFVRNPKGAAEILESSGRTLPEFQKRRGLARTQSRALSSRKRHMLSAAVLKELSYYN